MLYTPGPKARAEYRAFARRGGPTVLEVEPLPLTGGPLASARRPRAVAAGGGADRAGHHPGHGRRPGAGPRRGGDPGPDRASRLADRDETGQGRRPGGLAGRGDPERPCRPQRIRVEGRASTARGGAAGPGTREGRAAPPAAGAGGPRPGDPGGSGRVSQAADPGRAEGVGSRGAGPGRRRARQGYEEAPARLRATMLLGLVREHVAQGLGRQAIPGGG